MLSKQVGDKNIKKDPITDGEVEALQTGLTTVLQALLQLAQFKEKNRNKVKVLDSLPISSKDVSDLQTKMDKARDW